MGRKYILLFFMIFSFAFAEGEREEKYWELTCDNTLTCRLEGIAYGGLSLLFSRKANEQVKAKIAFLDLKADENGVFPNDFCLFVNDEKKECSTKNTLEKNQIDMVLNAIETNNSIKFHINNENINLPLKGAMKALLKMDKIQGKVGTIGALVKKGKKENVIIKPKDMPTIVAATPKITSVDDLIFIHKYKNAIKKSIKNFLSKHKARKYECIGFDGVDSIFDIKRLDSGKFIAYDLCSMFDFYTFVGFWIINDKLPFKVEFVTSKGVKYDKGKIFGEWYQNSSGECYKSSNYIWNGQKFEKYKESSTGQCLGIEGGTWVKEPILTYIAKVDYDKIDKENVKNQYKKFLDDLLIHVKKNENVSFIKLDKKVLNDLLLHNLIDETNMEKYNKLASYISSRATKKDSNIIELSSFLFQKVLEKDADFANAYLGLANNFYFYASKDQNQEMLQKSIEYYKKYYKLLEFQGKIGTLSKKTLYRYAPLISQHGRQDLEEMKKDFEKALAKSDKALMMSLMDNEYILSQLTFLQGRQEQFLREFFNIRAFEFTKPHKVLDIVIKPRDEQMLDFCYKLEENNGEICHDVIKRIEEGTPTYGFVGASG